MIATFFYGEQMVAGRTISLGGAEVQHARVRRIGVGERIRLTDGAGVMAWGTIVKLGKTQAMVELDAAEQMPPLGAVHLMVPVADRDRMLWLAEKATELGVSTWRPVSWRRSRSVTPRGEGVTFQTRVRSRMIAALTQSGGAWLPSIYPDATPERALAACAAGARWLLDGAGAPPSAVGASSPLTIVVGPEGGLEPDERAALLGAGFEPVRLAPLTLRFETAAVAGLAVARAAIDGAPLDRAPLARPALARAPVALSTLPPSGDAVPEHCLFCRIIRGEIPSTTVAETDDVVAFRDIDPQAPVHVVVVPRQHVSSLNSATDPALVGRLALVAAEIAKQEGIAESGYRTVINTNADAGQTVFHIHLHLLGGRRMHWPPG